MANKKTYSKRQKDMKSKLMAAVCMLLVSSIMMVSSTYAWFTLSTAPEVTGITTQVGANGNLEMALLPSDAITLGQSMDYGITSNVADSGKAQNERNVTWGNLVDLGLHETNYYGLDKISLYPSELNIEAGATALPETILATPGYGADGRVSELLKNTVTGIYDTQTGKFPEAANAYGVRAVGTASGMTNRQLAYRNARSAANTAMSQAKNNASASLNTNGAALANIAIAAKASNAPNTQADIASLQAIVCDLLGYSFVATSEGATHYQVATDVTLKDSAGNESTVTRYSYHTADASHTATHKIDETGKGVLDQIEAAYKNYIIAYVASAKGQTAGVTDENFGSFQSLVDGMTVYEMLTNEHVGKILTEASVSEPLEDLQETRDTVEEAFSKLDQLTAAEIEWATLSPAMSLLVDTNAIKINNLTPGEIMDDPFALVMGMQDGLTVVISSGGGVYADIADHCGDYNAAIQLVLTGIEYDGKKLDGTMNARMETNGQKPAILPVVAAAVEAAKSPSGAGASDMPITDMYGYIIDLGFRTNAAESNLLLQTEAADRIYSDNADDAETRGNGSTMTFTSTPTDFTLDQLKSLMGAIRVVFFDTTNRTILANAKLDMTEGNLKVVGGNTVTANLYLYKVDSVTKAETLLTTQSDAVITSLNQNAAKTVSVLVYLDGKNITNASVGATAATTMTGTMNLQFASSANLEPMVYTPLQTQGNNQSATEATTEATTAPQG